MWEKGRLEGFFESSSVRIEAEKGFCFYLQYGG